MYISRACQQISNELLFIGNSLYFIIFDSSRVCVPFPTLMRIKYLLKSGVWFRGKPQNTSNPTGIIRILRAYFLSMGRTSRAERSFTSRLGSFAGPGSSIGAGDRLPDTRQHAHPSPPAVFYCFTVTDIKPSRP